MRTEFEHARELKRTKDFDHTRDFGHAGWFEHALRLAGIERPTPSKQQKSKGTL